MTDAFEAIAGARSAWLDLSRRGTLRVAGSDRVRFLHAMLSNDVAALEAGDTRHSLLLDRKGRILSDLFVLALEDAILLDVAPGTAATVFGALGKFIVADDVELENLSDDWRQIAVEGPSAREALQGTELETGRLEAWGSAPEPLLAIGGGSLTPGGFRLLGPVALVSEWIENAGLAELDRGAAEVLRIEAFLPAYGLDVTDRHFPQEARLERAMSLTKGCFVGQEIVARIQSRGAVNRLLVQLSVEASVERGAAIRSGESLVGEVTSSAVSPALGPLALGYVRAPQAVPGTQLLVGEVSGRVIGPPLEAAPGAH